MFCINLFSASYKHHKDILTILTSSLYKNKDDNIHKSKALKSEENHKFVTKLLKFRTLYKDVLSFLGFNHRDVLRITLILFVLGITIQKVK